MLFLYLLFLILAILGLVAVLRIADKGLIDPFTVNQEEDAWGMFLFLLFFSGIITSISLVVVEGVSLYQATS